MIALYSAIILKVEQNKTQFLDPINLLDKFANFIFKKTISRIPMYHAQNTIKYHVSYNI